MDKILMSKMMFFGFHGVLPEETTLGQKFIVDATLYIDTRKAGLTDELEFSVSYADVYNDMKTIVEGPPYKLIEALAEKIAQVVLENHQLIKGIKVSVKKPEAPVRGIFDYFGVEIERMR